jgi:hypothetical protein
MKKLMFAICFLFAAAVAVNAQDTTAITPSQPQAQDQSQDMNKDQGEAVASSELPAPIQQSLQGQDYSGWTVGNAYKKEKDGKTVYAVELSNGSETKKVKFDEQGNKLKEKDKE